jgi:catechol 2,3-dioxygenase-like lactoylglutathione lyase family enzyme
VSVELELDHIELFVPDPLEAVSWYEKSLGFKILSLHYHWFEEGGPLMISNDGGRTMIALFRGEAQGKLPVVGFRRVAFRVSAQKFIEFINNSKIWRPQCLGKSNIEDHQQSISAYFADPYGNLLEVTSYEPEEIRAHFGIA